MGVKALFVCVLCQTIITISFGAIKLPFIDLSATVVPDNPSLLPLAQNGLPPLSSPTVPKSSDVILECLRSMYLGADLPSSASEYSSPLVLTSSSRGLPVPRVEALQANAVMSSNNKPQSSITLPMSPYKTDYRYKPNIYSESSLPLQKQNTIKLASVPNTLSPTVSNTNVFSLPCVNSLPIICLEALKRNINGLNEVSTSSSYLPTCSPPDSKMSFQGSPNPLYGLPYPLQYNQVLLPNVLPPSGMRVPTSNPMNNFDMNTFTRNSYTDKLNPYSPTLPQTHCPINRTPSNSATINRVPRVPFSRPTKSYAETQTFDNSRHSRNDPMRDRLVIDKCEPISRVSNINSGFNSWNSYYPPIPSFTPLGFLPEPNIPEVQCLDFTPPIFNFEPSPLYTSININKNTDVPNNFNVPDMQSTIDTLIDTVDCNFNANVEYFLSGEHLDIDIPKIPNTIPDFIPFRELSFESTPDISLLPVCLNKNENPVTTISCVDKTPNTILEISSPPTIKYPPKIPLTSIIPATYINVSPTYTLAKTSSNAVSSLNTIVSSMTRNILSSFMSYLTSPKIPITKPPSNPYGVPLPTRALTQPSPSLNLNLMPNAPQILYTPTALPLQTNSYYEVPLVPIENTLSNTPFLYADLTAACYDDTPSSILTSNSNDGIVTITETFSLPPLKVSLLPSMSFVDYKPLQPCPSALPSPILPSFVDISAPNSVQPQVVKIKSSDRKYKTLDKLLELVFLAELFHREDIDWDSLDTVLAVMCGS